MGALAHQRGVPGAPEFLDPTRSLGQGDERERREPSVSLGNDHGGVRVLPEGEGGPGEITKGTYEPVCGLSRKDDGTCRRESSWWERQTR